MIINVNTKIFINYDIMIIKNFLGILCIAVYAEYCCVISKKKSSDFRNDRTFCLCLKQVITNENTDIEKYTKSASEFIDSQVLKCES